MPSLVSNHQHALDEHQAVTILYATETGTAQDVAERLARYCRRLHFTIRAFSIDEYSTVRRLSMSTACIA